MGCIMAREAVARGFTLVGAVEASTNPKVGSTLGEAGICDSDIEIVDPSRIKEAVNEADVYMSFTTPQAEVSNLPVVAMIGKRIVMGTTGLTDEQMRRIKEVVSEKVPAVFSPNYAIGVNIMFQMTKTLALLPSDYDFSIIEIHHTAKKDAPSGTAKKLGTLVSEVRGYSTIIHGREGQNRRRQDELEILSVRAGGVPGVHDLTIAGSHEMIRIEHTAFSRRVFAHGALYAAEWICKQTKPGIYSMNDVLG
jgi:4-hydroxy-tetrahydrodipicolinate reductase